MQLKILRILTISIKVDSRKKKAWAVAGIAVHLLGDTFAHRAMVPTEATYSKQYFTDTKLKELNKRTDEYVIEFRDIKKYSKASIKTADINKVYEDNPQFYSNRFDAASAAIGIMVEDLKALNGYNIIKILKNCGIDTTDEKTRIRLNNLVNYGNSAGYTGTDLALYSTSGYKANYIDNACTPGDLDVYDYPTGAVC